MFFLGSFCIVTCIVLSASSYVTGELQVPSAFFAGVTLVVGLYLMKHACEKAKFIRFWTKWRRTMFLSQFDEDEMNEKLSVERKSTHIRSGFTLIELLVVITIITILAALLTVGLWAILGKSAEVSNRAELNKLGLALTEFKKQYGIYPPSRIKLCETFKEYDVNNPNNPTLQFDRESVATLNTIWTNLDWSQQFKWAGSNPIPKGGLIIEGHQCLVFFLGGIPDGSGNAPLGFYKNPFNPTVIPGTVADKIKFFEFEARRCILIQGAHFPSYLDMHFINHKRLIPYIYYSSYKRPNGYVDIDNSFFRMKPYLKSPQEYYNSTTFQLISAGPNGLLGSGQTVPTIGAGVDDIANFWDKNLGVGK